MRSSKINLLGILTISAALFVIANYCDIGYTYDSNLYVEIAGQISDYGFNAEGFNIKPPVYPLLIYWFGKDSIFIINLVCLLISVSVLFYFGLEIKNKVLRFLFWGILAFSTPLYYVHSFAWTEPPFISVLLLAFLALHTYQKNNKPQFLYVSMTLLLLLPFIRFAGLFILVPTFLVLFIKLSSKKKWVIAGVVNLGAFAIVMWGLQFEDGFASRWRTLIGPLVRGDSFRYLHNLDSYLEALSIWLLPIPIYKPVRLFFAAIVLIFIAIAAVNFFRKGKYIVASGIPFIFITYYFLLQLVFDVEYYSAERYLTPLYNLLLFSMFMWFDKNFLLINKTLKKAMLVFLFYLLTYGIARTLKNVVFWNQTRCTEIVKPKPASSSQILKENQGLLLPEQHQ